MNITLRAEFRLQEFELLCLKCLFDPMDTCYFKQIAILVFMNVPTPVKALK